jgi:hypothetical protein
MTILLALGWRWCRVSGSAVVHLVPGTILRGSRTACNRLSVYDATVEVPAPLIGELRRCMACEAYGGRGGRG